MPQDKESYGSDTSHDRKRQLLGGHGVLSLRSFVGQALALFLCYCFAGGSIRLLHKGDCYEGTAVSDSSRTDQIHKKKI